MSIRTPWFAILLVSLNLCNPVAASTAVAGSSADNAMISDPALTSFVRAVGNCKGGPDMNSREVRAARNKQVS